MISYDFFNMKPTIGKMKKYLLNFCFLVQMSDVARVKINQICFIDSMYMMKKSCLLNNFQFIPDCI